MRIRPVRNLKDDKPAFGKDPDSSYDVICWSLRSLGINTPVEESDFLKLVASIEKFRDALGGKGDSALYPCLVVLDRKSVV